MKRFTIDAPDGRQVTVEGDDEPNDDEVEEILKTLPKKSDPVLKKIEAAITALSEREPKAPIVNIQPPNVTVKHETPKRWDIEVTSRDEFGRIKTFTIEARK